MQSEPRKHLIPLSLKYTYWAIVYLTSGGNIIIKGLSKQAAALVLTRIELPLRAHEGDRVSCADHYFTENQYIALNKRLLAPLPMLTAD